MACRRTEASQSGSSAGWRASSRPRMCARPPSSRGTCIACRPDRLGLTSAQFRAIAPRPAGCCRRSAHWRDIGTLCTTCSAGMRFGASGHSGDMSPIRLIARPMLASMFVVGGINSLKNTDALADRAEPVTEKLEPVVEQATSSLPIHLDQRQLVQLNGVVHVVGGAMLATGKLPRLAALALAATLVPTTFGGHRFWEETDP